MATLKVNSASLTSVANALRTAGNTADELTFPAGFVSAIESLSGSTGGVQMAVGTQTLSSAASLTVENLPFTPNRAVLLLIRRSTTKGVLVNAVSDPGSSATAYGAYTNSTSGYISTINTNNFTFGQNSMTYTAASTYTIYGIYLYLVWRDEEAA